MIFKFVDRQLQYASHGQYYNLGNILVVDSELLSGLFSTDYHVDLRGKLNWRK